MGFTIGKTTLADVQAKLGCSERRKCSYDSEADDEVCYVAPDKDGTIVVFASGAVGGWTELTGYKVISSSVDAHCYRQCFRSRKVNRKVKTKAGLRLGLTREQLVALLGAPSEVRGNTLIFSRSLDMPPYYVIDVIRVTLENSRVVAFEVKHIKEGIG